MNLFSTLAGKITAAVVTVVAAVGITNLAIAGFGPDRPIKDWSQDKTGFGYVTYNSFINIAGKGDERNFLEGVQVGRDATWRDPVTDITNDAEVEVKLYMHNNADTSLNASGNGVARNVTARVSIPQGLTAAKDITGYISASNANPVTVTDTLSLTGVNGSIFELEPVIGSGKLIANGTQISTVDVAQLVAGGVNLPDQNGCSEFVREITFRVKVKKPGYQVRKSARLAGEGADAWRENVNAKIGDKVEWRIFFQNIGSTTLNDVKIVDDVPPYMTVVPNTVELVNSNNPNGFKYGPEAVQKNGTQINVDIEDYAPQGGAYLYFFTTINDDPKLCGNVGLQNVAYATPSGFGAVNDGAFVTVVTNRTCEEPKEPTYTCDAVTIEKLGGRKVKVSVSYTAAPADRVKLKNFEVNFGDGSTVLTTTNAVNEYTYAKDGTYNVSVKVNLTVDGKTVTVSGDKCAKVVTFGSTPTPPTTIPDTGAGSVVGLFASVMAVSMLGFRAYASRQN